MKKISTTFGALLMMAIAIQVGTRTADAACTWTFYPEFNGPTGPAQSRQGKQLGDTLDYATMAALHKEGVGWVLCGGVCPEQGETCVSWFQNFDPNTMWTCICLGPDCEEMQGTPLDPPRTEDR